MNLATSFFLSATVLLLSTSCATKPPAKQGDSRSEARGTYTMAGYELKGRGETRQNVIARYGQPLAEENLGDAGQYRILSYPVSGDPDKLLLLFQGDELLGVAREKDRAVLTSTVSHHQRVQGGRVILLQSWFDGKTTYFVAGQDQIAKVPKWSFKNAGNPPVSGSQAEAFALAWRREKAPALLGEPKVLKAHEHPSIPGLCFYEVHLGDFRAPAPFRLVVVLMDGSVIAGEPELKK